MTKLDIYDEIIIIINNWQLINLERTYRFTQWKSFWRAIMQDEFLPSRKWWSAHVRRRLRAHLHVVFLSNRIIAPCSTPDFVVPPPSPFSSCLSCTCLLTSCKIVHWSSLFTSCLTFVILLYLQITVQRRFCEAPVVELATWWNAGWRKHRTGSSLC